MTPYCLTLPLTYEGNEPAINARVFPLPHAPSLKETILNIFMSNSRLTPSLGLVLSRSAKFSMVCFEIVVFGASDGVFECTVNELTHCLVCVA